MKLQNIFLSICLFYYSCIFPRCSSAGMTEKEDQIPFSCTLSDYTNERLTPFASQSNTEISNIEQSDTMHQMLSIVTQFTASNYMAYFKNSIKDSESLFTDTFNHYGSRYYPQWQLSYFKNERILSIFFKGTDMRINDLTVDLLVTHTTVPLKNGKSINVHDGVYERIANNSIFLEHLESDLQYLKDKYLSEYGYNPLENIKFLIQGHSLGGGYATFFLLLMYDVDIYALDVKSNVKNSIRNIQILLGIPAQSSTTSVMQPSETTAFGYELKLENVYMITLGSIMIVYHEDCKGILSNEVVDRMWFFMNTKDPVPMLFGGKKNLQTDRIKKHNIFRWGAKDKALAFAANGAINCAHYFVFSDDGKSYLMDDDAIEIHLNEGAKCAWRSEVSRLNIAWHFKDCHVTSVYREKLDSMIDYSGCKIEKPEKVFIYDVDVDLHIVYGLGQETCKASKI